METMEMQIVSQVKSSIIQYQQQLDAVRALERPVTKKEPFVISFVGKFKTGKSSLINALLGMEVLPTKATTCTSVVTRIFRGRKQRAWLCTNGNREAVSMDAAKKAIQEYQVEDPAAPLEVILELPIRWLSYGVELRDTPGMDDSAQNGHLETIALNSLKDTDLCICVYDASSMISSKEKERSRFIHQSMGGNVVHIVNRTNLLNNVQQLREIESLCDSFFGGLKPFDNKVEGTGAYYTVCSAPGMIELDNFDVWLRKIVSGKRTFWKKMWEWLFKKMIATPEKDQLRTIAAKGKLNYKSGEIKALASMQMLMLEDTWKQQKALHAKRREQLLEEGKQRAAALAKEIRDAMPKAASSLKSIGNLEEKLTAQLDTLKGQRPFKWKTLCDVELRNCAEEHFVSNWKSYCDAGEQVHVAGIEPGFVRDAIQAMRFPGYAYISKWGGLRKVDDTVPAAMGYIYNSVLPVLEQNLKEHVIEVANREKAAVIHRAEQTPTGIEGTIASIEEVQVSLRKYM